MERRSCENQVMTVPGSGMTSAWWWNSRWHEFGRRLRGQREEEGLEAAGWRGAGQDTMGPLGKG